jgi:DNA topoisomerase IB
VYRYHPRWRKVRDEAKYGRLVDFARALPRIRRRTGRDLRLRGLPREKVLAVVVRLLEETLIRVGNDEYARENRSYGLSTMRSRHVSVRGESIRFSFRGKAGKEHEVDVRDRRLARIVKQCQELPGQELFQYRDDDGRRVDVTSNDVNAYLREITGQDFTAKDFRTWGATLEAFRRLAATTLPYRSAGDHAPSERALKGLENAVVKEVAHALGNTPAVCRRAYIDPRVFEGWRDGRLQRAAASAAGNGSGPRGPRQWEQAALKFLRAAHRPPRRS